MKLTQYLSTTKNVSCEKTWRYVNKTLMPGFLASLPGPTEDICEKLTQLSKYGLKLPVSRDTVWRWMGVCGAVRGTYKASYYSDRHNDSDVVEDRTDRYLPAKKQLELRCPVWAVISHKQFAKLGPALHSFKSKTGVAMPYHDLGEGQGVEVHVDALPIEVRLSIPQGGRISRRAKVFVRGECGVHTAEKCKCHLPAHMMGQDESIYWQYLLSSKVWYINGACGLRKKGNGPGIMVSAFVSEQFGFGMPLSPSQLSKVNDWRASKMGPNPDECTKKRYKPLTESPALRFLKYGKNRDGWWNYEMMAQQCEGIIICM